MNKIHLKIGSASDNQIVMKSVDVAPHHLEFFCDTDGNVFITDLGSEQGTYINNRRLDGFQLLKKGDRVRLGQNLDFLWEQLLPKLEQKKAKPVAPPQPKVYEHKTTEPKKEVSKAVSSNTSNKQLFLIYGLIIVLFILLSLYL
ncbi:MAG: FHA domain-containing protein [Crocinitomicaceae bacterium]|jgi:pSer/pThr/pTyr-binding forkhead associated (FHA) protein